MDEGTEKTLNDLFPGWEPVEIEDDEGLDFDKPLKGKYEVRIAKVERYSGTCKDGVTPYDFVSLSLQITEDVEGDKGNNRYLSKTYSCIDGKYSTKEEDLQKLLNDLFTAGILQKLTLTTGGYEGILEQVDNLIDKTALVSCWGTKKGNQVVKFVVSHKLKKESSEDTGDVAWDN